MRRSHSQTYSAFSLTLILLTHKISMYIQLKNKCNHTKAHHFYLLSTYNSQHIILISSQRNCTGTSVNQMTLKNKYKKVSKMKAKYKEKALQQ